jgi:16S rRNA (uracil1498-N3)-methyltransferase
MRLTRVYHSDSLEIALQLDERASHHLASVLRIHAGDECVVFDGKGNEAQYQVVLAKKKQVELRQIKMLENTLESTISIHLCQAIAKGDKMDWILQKAVELGVTEITPVFTQQCDVRLDAHRLEKKIVHWQAVMISACQQSGRAVLPKLSFPGMSFSDFIQNSPVDVTKLIFSPFSEKPLREVVPTPSYLIAIGPEGGFSESEVASAMDCGYEPTSLGKRILRTETAAVSAVSTLQSLFDY